MLRRAGRCLSGLLALLSATAGLAVVPLAHPAAAQTHDGLVSVPEVVFVREGQRETVRLTLNGEITSQLPIAATSSDTAGITVNHPDSLFMGRSHEPCVPGPEGSFVDPDTGQVKSVVTGGPPGCGQIRGRLVQTRVVQPDTPEGSPTYRAPSASINFSFDARDWAGYTSQDHPELHKGWREVVVHSQRRCTAPGTTVPQLCYGPDRVYDLTITRTDTSEVLTTVKVVVIPGQGRKDPVITPHCRNERCLPVDEGGSTTYTIRNHIVPRPGEPLTVTPRLLSGSGVTIEPSSVSWTSVDDFDEPRTVTVTAAHDDDSSDGEFTIAHDFSDNYVTNGRLGRSRNESWFNLAGTVVDDDGPTLPDLVIAEVGGDTLTGLSLNSNTGGTTSFELRFTAPPADCESRYLPEFCSEAVVVKLQTETGRTRVPVDGVVTMVTRTVNGVDITKPACELFPSTLSRYYWKQIDAGESVAGLKCENRVTYDRPPFAASWSGSSRQVYELRHKVTPDNWDEPVRIDLAMVSDFGSSGSYRISLSMSSEFGPTVRKSLPVSYGSTLISTSEADGFVPPQPENVVVQVEDPVQPVVPVEDPVQPVVPVEDPVQPVVQPVVVPPVEDPVQPVVVPPVEDPVQPVVPAVDPVQPVALSVCDGLPTVLVDDVEASRSDVSVDFVVSLDCRPRRTVAVIYVIVRDGEIVGGTKVVRLSAAEPVATVTVDVDAARSLGLTVAYAWGASYGAEGTLTYTD